MARRIIISGGGTGGHIFPAIAIANALKKIDPEVDILFVGARGKMEMEKVPQAGYPIEGLDIAGFNRSSLIKNIGLPVKLVKSFLQVRRLFARFRPDAAIGVGGYSTFPVLRYAQQKGIPTYIHESNAFAGKANIMLGKKATRILVAADGMEKFFPASRIVKTGNPVRHVFTETGVSREEALKFWELEGTKPVLLVVGGSLGAKSINEAVLEGVEQLENAGIQLIWQTGKLFADTASKAVDGKDNMKAMPFIKEMEMAYAAADLVVSRAGAMAIAELCVVGKPVVFVPYPHAAEDHQTVNARNLESVGAGIMIKDSEVKKKLIATVLKLAGNTAEMEKLKQNIHQLAVGDADIKIANLILNDLKK